MSYYNLPKEQMVALNELIKKKDITILKPDKGSGIVILNKVYLNKMNDIIADESK